MATKTLSVDEEAYRMVSRAKRSSTESLSKVVKRARWDIDVPRCGDLPNRAVGSLPKSTLDELEAAQEDDRPPAVKSSR